jgi:hypothetical protein
MESTGHSPQFTETTIGRHRHICAVFFVSPDQLLLEIRERQSVRKNASAAQ